METSWFIALYRIIIYVGFVASSFSLCEMTINVTALSRQQIEDDRLVGKKWDGTCIATTTNSL